MWPRNCVPWLKTQENKEDDYLSLLALSRGHQRKGVVCSALKNGIWRQRGASGMGTRRRPPLLGEATLWGRSSDYRAQLGPPARAQQHWPTRYSAYGAPQQVTHHPTLGGAMGPTVAWWGQKEQWVGEYFIIMSLSPWKSGRGRDVFGEHTLSVWLYNNDLYLSWRSLYKPYENQAGQRGEKEAFPWKEQVLLGLCVVQDSCCLLHSVNTG